MCYTYICPEQFTDSLRGCFQGNRGWNLHRHKRLRNLPSNPSAPQNMLLLCPDSKYTHSNPFNSSSMITIMMIRRRNDSLQHHNLSDKMKYRSSPDKDRCPTRNPHSTGVLNHAIRN
ncbi:hypothetical protein CDAR_245931 [Caerostris darwini]|uniref:Uncharacterized protein n=1 Tax=Caerostris darwini TaxID=1538125 RepID=A0AAV4W6B8_9ARAC|nr:hypothetical protein CDAR_245931 [Caerostris darwini]